VEFVHRDRDGVTVLVGGGRYLDRLEKRDGEWRIAVRRLVMDYSYIVDGSAFGDGDRYPIGTWDRSDLSYRRPLEIPADLLARVTPSAASWSSPRAA
jgi:hypothetical protein